MARIFVLALGPDLLRAMLDLGVGLQEVHAAPRGGAIADLDFARVDPFQAPHGERVPIVVESGIHETAAGAQTYTFDLEADRIEQ